MKVKIEKEKFRPVTITIETEEELKALMWQMIIIKNHVTNGGIELTSALEKYNSTSTAMFSQLLILCNSAEIDWEND